MYRVGFGAMIALLLLVAAEAYRIQETTSKQTSEIYRKHVRAVEAMSGIRRLIYLGSIATRDYFLSTQPDRRAKYQQQAEQLRLESAALLTELEHSGGVGSRAPDLRQLVQDFWSAIRAVTEGPESPRTADAYEFVQSEIVPRRTAASTLLRELSAASEQAMRESQNEFDGSRRNALIRLFGMVGLCVAVAFVIALLSLRHAGRWERESAMRFNEVAQARRDLQQLSARLLQIQEDERTRISRELHDEIGQTLTALRIEISRALVALKTQPAAVEARLEEARLLAEKTVATVRDISVLLRPSLLDDLGVEPALQSLVEDFTRRSGIRCGFTSQQLADDLPDAYRTSIYRVVQEALTNCARHSSATHVDVCIRCPEGRIEVEIADNGRGFRIDAHGAPEGKKGLGILGMRERAVALDGTLTLESAPGEGTRVVMGVPWPRTVGDLETITIGGTQ